MVSEATNNACNPSILGNYGAIPFEQFLGQLGTRLTRWRALPSPVCDKQYDYICEYLAAHCTPATLPEEQWAQLSQKVVRLLQLSKWTQPNRDDEMARRVDYINSIAQRTLFLDDSTGFAPIHLLGPEGQDAVVSTKTFNMTCGEYAADYLKAGQQSSFADNGIDLAFTSPKAFEAFLDFVQGKDAVPDITLDSEDDLGTTTIIDLFSIAHRLQIPRLQELVSDSCEQALNRNLGARYLIETVIQPIADLDEDAQNLMLPLLASYYENAAIDHENIVPLLEGALRYARPEQIYTNSAQADLHEAVNDIFRFAKAHTDPPAGSVRCADFCSLIHKIDVYDDARLSPEGRLIGTPSNYLIKNILTGSAEALFSGVRPSTITKTLLELHRFIDEEPKSLAITRLLNEWPTLPVTAELLEEVYGLQQTLLCIAPCNEALRQWILPFILQMAERPAEDQLILQLIERITRATEPCTVADIAPLIEAAAKNHALSRSRLNDVLFLLADMPPSQISRPLVVPILLSIQNPFLFREALANTLARLNDCNAIPFLNELFKQAADPLIKRLVKALLFNALCHELANCQDSSAGILDYLDALHPSLRNDAKLLYAAVCPLESLRRWVLDSITQPKIENKAYAISNERAPEESFTDRLNSGRSLIRDWELVANFRSSTGIVTGPSVVEPFSYTGYSSKAADVSRVLAGLGPHYRNQARTQHAMSLVAANKQGYKRFVNEISCSQTRQRAAAWIEELQQLQTPRDRMRFLHSKLHEAFPPAPADDQPPGT